MVPGTGLTNSSTVYPLPTVKTSVFWLAMVPISKSPFVVVVRFPLFGDALVPVAATLRFREFDVATPEYSKMATRSGPETLMVTLTVFAPPLMFSA